MASEVASNPLYIMVVDDSEEEKRPAGFRYTTSVLQSTLQLMGCKPRHAFKISRRVFELVRNEGSHSGGLCSESEAFGRDGFRPYSTARVHAEVGAEVPFEAYKKRTTFVVGRETFLRGVCDVMAEYKYVGPNQRADLVLACRIKERKESVTVLLCGTSGCGKSTLSALLGSRLGITTVISTDSIRHMMRSFVDEKQSPLLWASTYHAGDCLDPAAVAEAKARRRANKLAGGVHPQAMEEEGTVSAKRMAIEGFKAQSEMVIDSLDRLITSWEERKESVVIEGVHLSLNFVMGLMRKHPSIIPFMVYIGSEEKHLERFAVRAKYMTLDPAKNRYVKYIRNIRTIQDYLCKQADKHLVPKINNTNVDKSVAVIHATVFSCLRRRVAGELLLCDPVTNTTALLDEEYRNQRAANSLSSKGMFQLIRRQGSSRRLMALLNTDGSVAKAWPVDERDGPSQIGVAEPIHLQFGHFGISAWPSDGATSHSGSVDEQRAELSSSCSSPRLSDAHSKELKEENSVHESDEEVDEADSDDDLWEEYPENGQDEIGSVDDDFTKSDEEYDDLVMQDVNINGLRIDDGTRKEKVKKRAVLLRSKTARLVEPFCSHPSYLMGKGERLPVTSLKPKMNRRSLSIPANRQLQGSHR